MPRLTDSRVQSLPSGEYTDYVQRFLHADVLPKWGTCDARTTHKRQETRDSIMRPATAGGGTEALAELAGGTDGIFLFASNAEQLIPLYG